MPGSIFGIVMKLNKAIYVTGMFNYSLTQNLKYIIRKTNLRKAILIKQGFTNYEYTIA
jgi:putative heme iron utilization protein